MLVTQKRLLVSQLLAIDYFNERLEASGLYHLLSNFTDLTACQNTFYISCQPFTRNYHNSTTSWPGWIYTNTLQIISSASLTLCGQLEMIAFQLLQCHLMQRTPWLCRVALSVFNIRSFWSWLGNYKLVKMPYKHPDFGYLLSPLVFSFEKIPAFLWGQYRYSCPMQMIPCSL